MRAVVSCSVAPMTAQHAIDCARARPSNQEYDMNPTANMHVSRIVAAVMVPVAVTALASCSGPVAEAGKRSADGGTDATVRDARADGRTGDTTRPDAGADGGAESGSSSSTIPWNGGNYYLYGVNYPWLTYGVDFGNGPWGHLANPAQAKADMATFAKEGGHFLRWWVWVDGRYDPLFASSGQVTGFDPQFFSDLDTALQYAADNHIYLDLTLLDTSVLVLLIPNGMLTVNSPPAHGGIEVAATGRAAWEPSEECA
jgi:hypothetical protein